MTDNKMARNRAAVTGIGTAFVFSSLWLPWIFVPVEVLLKRDQLPDFEFPEMRILLTPFSTMETGLGGAVDVGMLIPTWIFIFLMIAAGALSMLTILKIFETSHRIVIALLAIPGGFLTYWVGAAIAEGSKLQAGFPVAAISAAAILLPAIMNHRHERGEAGR